MSDEVQPRGAEPVLAIAASLCRAVLAIAPAALSLAVPRDARHEPVHTLQSLGLEQC
jgi:hypothetical protein